MKSYPENIINDLKKQAMTASDENMFPSRELLDKVSCKALSERSLQIYSMHYVENMTIKEVAQIVGVSHVMIHKIINQSIIPSLLNYESLLFSDNKSSYIVPDIICCSPEDVPIEHTMLSSRFVKALKAGRVTLSNGTTLFYPIRTLSDFYSLCDLNQGWIPCIAGIGRSGYKQLFKLLTYRKQKAA